MSPDNVKSFGNESFKIRLEQLAEEISIEDAAFADAIYAAVTQFGIDEERFRDAFGLTKGAVERWMQRQNLPQPLVRSKIILWIKTQL